MTRAALLAPLLTCFLLGCSALVRSGNDDAKCVRPSGAADPCPAGQACIDGRCRSPSVDGCVPTSEQCGDGIDNDCDDAIDEGGEEICNGEDDDCDDLIDEGHDHDGDAFTWCGGGRENLRDCDDAHPDVHPGTDTILPAPEKCDGKDNDCNGAVDDSSGAALCEGDEQCIGQQCVVPNCTHPGHACPPEERCDVTVSPPSCRAGDCTQDGCELGYTCDPVSRSCVVRQALGAECVTDAQCESEACFPRESLRLSGKNGICGKACCTDSECGSNELCWVSGSGARSCVLATAVGLERGPGDAMTNCNEDSDCASGVCRDNARQCVENCGHDDACWNGGTCGVVQYSHPVRGSGFMQLSCIEEPGNDDLGEGCDEHRDCESGICLFSFVCSRACRTGSDCPSGTYCNYYSLVTGSSDSTTDYASVCYTKTHSGNGITGAACDSPSDCRDFTCIDDECADTCCGDSQCPTDTSCKPIPAGGESAWEMHCLP